MRVSSRPTEKSFQSPLLSIALGTALAGTLAKYYDPTDEMPYFLAVGGAAVIFGMLLAVTSP